MRAGWLSPAEKDSELTGCRAIHTRYTRLEIKDGLMSKKLTGGSL